MSDQNEPIIQYQDAWKSIKTIIDILIENIEKGEKYPLSASEMSSVYNLIFTICSKRDTAHCDENLLENYVVILREYKEKSTEVNYNKLVSYMIKMFRYLERYFMPTFYLPKLEVISEMILNGETKLFYPKYPIGYRKSLKILEIL